MREHAVLSDPKAIIIAGEKIYEQQYKERFEPSDLGKFLAIDVVTGEAILADDGVGALERARAAHPDRPCYLMKIGSPSLCRVGFWPSDALR